MYKTRIQWIDFARVLAILSVVFCPCLDNIYHIIDPNVVTALSLSSKIFVFSGYVIGRLGVPFFLMITGYLLLDRIYDSEKITTFWSRNCKHLLICTIIWCVIYEAFLIFVLHQDFNLVSVISEILLLKPLNISHFWYMPMIIGMYILIPFVSTALKNLDNKIIFKAVTFFLIICSVIPFILLILNIYGIDGLSEQISLGYSGGIYGIYIVIGYLIKKDYFKSINNYKLILTIIISAIITVIFQIFSFNHDYAYYLWYEFPFLLIISVCLFELISRLKTIKFYNIISFMSKFSFAVFLIHILFVKTISQAIMTINIHSSIKVMILMAFILLLSYLTAYIISKIPKIGKYILYLK